MRLNRNQFMFKLEDKAPKFTSQEWQRYQDYLSSLKPDRYYITIKKLESERSLDQNNYYWGVIIPEILEFVGDKNTEIERLNLHDDLLKMFAPRRKSSITKEMTPIRSSRMDMAQFRNYIDNILHFFSREYGLVISEAEK